MHLFRLIINKLKYLKFYLAFIFIIFIIFSIFFDFDNSPSFRQKFVVHESRKNYQFNRQSPLIFIGGFPRSGTTLMRALLDAHPDVRCGEETILLADIINYHKLKLNFPRENQRLMEAGITKEIINSALSSYFLEIIVKHGEIAPRLCNKDPFTLISGTLLIEMFPNAKIIFMVRDGRASIHSAIKKNDLKIATIEQEIKTLKVKHFTRVEPHENLLMLSLIEKHKKNVPRTLERKKVTISGFDLNDYRQCLKKWNSIINILNTECEQISESNCLKVYYEQLVLHPRTQLEKILKFLDISWDESVMHHEDYINNEISLSKLETSSDQVIKPIYLSSLTDWVGHIPDDVLKDMATIVPMLSELGYDPNDNFPNFGEPDEEVKEKNKILYQNNKYLESKISEMFGNETIR